MSLLSKLVDRISNETSKKVSEHINNEIKRAKDELFGEITKIKEVINKPEVIKGTVLIEEIENKLNLKQGKKEVK